MELVKCKDGTKLIHDDDLFQVIDNEEIKFVKQSFNEGFHSGQMHALEEGMSLGQKKGNKLARDLGYYYGFSHFFLSNVNDKVMVKSKTNDKALHIFNDVVLAIRNFDISDTSLPEKYDVIRSLFKQASALLNMSSSVDKCGSLSF